MKIGIIGCGLIGQKRAVAAMESGAQVVAVADLDPARTKTLASRTGAKICDTWQALIAEDLDFVVVATTHDVLTPISLAAVEAGKHVLVEKPAARNAAEVLPLVEASRRTGRLVKVGFNHRFHPAIFKAHEMVEAGEIGPLLYARGRYGHGGRVGYEQEWRCKPEISGGGEMIDQGSHLIDLARWFFGDLTLGYAATPTLFWNIPVDDNCFIALEGKEGQIAWLHATWSEWKNTFSLEICGRDGKLTIEGLGGSYGVESLTYHKMLPQMGPPETTRWEYPFPDRSWHQEHLEFVTAIQENRAPIGNIEDAYAMLQIIDQAYKRS